MDDHVGRESTVHAGGKWETMNFLGVALRSGSALIPFSLIVHPL